MTECWWWWMVGYNNVLVIIVLKPQINGRNKKKMCHVG